jgi:predicted O-linked N-acetylglucosamine transferase (SPINDLY family)
MRHWGVALSNLRLAPIQLTALGHSASSFCPQVDYYVVEQGHAGDGSAFTETVALLPDRALRFERQPGLQAPAPRIRSSAPVPRIAVPSNALKLNASFLATLARIEQESPRRLEFHFFPNVAGFEGDAVRAAVKAVLPRATVWPVLEHAAYLERLNACDMTLSPFPFGGLHSTIDSLSQGLPVVAMSGDQPHARTDATMLRIAGMPDWLCTQDAGSYVAAALRIAGDDDLRVALSRQALGCDVPGRLFGDATTPLGSDVSRMFTWIHANHEVIQASGLRVVRVPGQGDAGQALSSPSTPASCLVSGRAG